ncbi:MAG: sulfatase-like hydrolase/transferase, partial [Pirellulales bacterium]
MKIHVLLPVLLGLAMAARATADERRANVLFLFTDDQRADTVAALGNPAIKTPNLDALARSGMVMNNAYCLGANISAVCTPSRNMLLSGRAYFRWKGNLAPGSEPNFPLSMREAGYETYHHGKRGNTAIEIQKRFDHDKYVDDEQARASGEPGKEIVDEAIAFLDRRGGERPFFMYLALANPHDARIAAPRFLDLYRRDEIPLPKNFLPIHPFDNGELKVRDEQLAPWPRTEDEIRRHLHEYYAVISGLDHHVGRLLDELKRRNEYENTIIIFSSDHGLAIGSHGLMGKQNLYEHSMKAPLIVSGPRIAPGRSAALVYLMDIYPTVCELAGAKVPPGLDGKSFAGLLRGKPAATRDTLFLAYRDVQRAVRDDRWKLIRYPQAGRTQLFDLATDPDEIHDLSADPDQAARIEQMTAWLRDWQQQLGDEFKEPARLPAAGQLPRRAELPDPLVMLDGGRVATPEEWHNRRKPELKRLFEHYMYGHAPPAPQRLEAA